MRKFGVFVAFLLIAFLAVNALYLFALSKVDAEFRKTDESVNFTDESFEILVLGNSTALDGVNTQMLSDSVGTAYNFSLAGSSIESNYIQLEHYLARNNRPEFVLFFLSSCHINYNREYVVNPIIENYYGLWRFELEELPLFKFRWLFIENFKKILSSERRKSSVVAGQLILERSVADGTVFENSSIANCTTDYQSKGYTFLKHIAQQCADQGIKFLAFEMPCWSWKQNNCDDVYVGFGPDVKFKVVNLNRRDVAGPLLNSRADWLSENHLNYAGSVKLFEAIKAAILEEEESGNFQ
ncbi:MAG: hypothetical protein RIG68_15940 [Imperialibacter sp.]|uniref:hypothetical protein n=1 Tax=Imperialibacter sp. TaxID=2038411 RepID=UPI0032EB4332